MLPGRRERPLTRIVNGGGFVDCEYGVGRGRVDILVRKPYTGSNGKRAVQREAVEVKVRRKKSGDPLAEGLAQLDGYLDRLGLDTGTLLIFDRRPSAVRKHPDPTFSTERTPTGREITLLRALARTRAARHPARMASFRRHGKIECS
jgi:hypothetical protein